MMFRALEITALCIGLSKDFSYPKDKQLPHRQIHALGPVPLHMINDVVGV